MNIAIIWSYSHCEFNYLIEKQLNDTNLHPCNCLLIWTKAPAHKVLITQLIGETLPRGNKLVTLETAILKSFLYYLLLFNCARCVNTWGGRGRGGCPFYSIHTTCTQIVKTHSALNGRVVFFLLSLLQRNYYGNCSNLKTRFMMH